VKVQYAPRDRPHPAVPRAVCFSEPIQRPRCQRKDERARCYIALGVADVPPKAVRGCIGVDALIGWNSFPLSTPLPEVSRKLAPHNRTLRISGLPSLASVRAVSAWNRVRFQSRGSNVRSQSANPPPPRPGPRRHVFCAADARFAVRERHLAANIVSSKTPSVSILEGDRIV
jgi:hypothetical protein